MGNEQVIWCELSFFLGCLAGLIALLWRGWVRFFVVVCGGGGVVFCCVVGVCVVCVGGHSGLV